MRYYCKSCGSVFIPAPHLNAWFQDNTVDYCPICLKGRRGGVDIYAAIPDFETPEQYEDRTGAPWHDDWAVWIFNQRAGTYYAADYEHAKKLREKHGLHEYPVIFCFQGPEAPPNGWRPE
jgi:hypothetical protein